VWKPRADAFVTAVSYHGKHRKRRPGVHKNRRSSETLLWEREQLIPEQPAWMSTDLYVELAKMRQGLEGAN
jgi:hypothetical protein